MILRRALTLVFFAGIATVMGVALVGWNNGFRFYVVDSGSMSPAVHAGDLVIDSPVGSSTILSVGDVITFHPTPAFTTTHRIVTTDAAGIVTKGDANETPDIGTLPASDVVGRVAFVVPYGGYVVSFLRQPAGIVALLLFMVVLYFIWGFAAEALGKLRSRGI